MPSLLSCPDPSEPVPVSGKLPLPLPAEVPLVLSLPPDPGPTMAMAGLPREGNEQGDTQAEHGWFVLFSSPALSQSLWCSESAAPSGSFAPAPGPFLGVTPPPGVCRLQKRSLGQSGHVPHILWVGTGLQGDGQCESNLCAFSVHTQKHIYLIVIILVTLLQLLTGNQSSDLCCWESEPSLAVTALCTGV